MVYASFNLKSQIFPFLDTILTILDPDSDPYSQYGSGSSIHVDPDPDLKHCLNRGITWTLDRTLALDFYRLF